MSNVIRTPCEEVVIRAAGACSPCTGAAARLVLAATVLGTSMAIIDHTAVNVALPVFQEELGATVSQVQWIVEAYALFLASLILVGGSLGDRFGRRRLFLIGITVFALASAACGLSGSPRQLIAARAVQGIGGALLMPGSLAILSSCFREEDRGHAIGTWSAFTAMAAVLGPVLGGWLVQSLSWRWIFFINLPVALVVVFLARGWVPESRNEAAAATLDWPGALLATFGLGGLVFGLIESSRLGWNHPLIPATLAGGAAALAAFILVEARRPGPMMPLGLFRSPTFSGTNLFTLLLYAALNGVTFFLPFNLIQVQGYPPAAAGAALIPFILLLSFLSRWTGGMVHRLGAKPLLVAGALLSGGGFALISAPGIGGSYWATFFPGITVLGLGMAFCAAPLTTAVMNSVGAGNVGVASGVNNAVARTAGLVAIAVMGVFALTIFNRELDRRLPALTISGEVRMRIDEQRVHLAAIEIPAGVAPASRDRLQGAIDGSFVRAFRQVAWVSVALSVAGAAVALVAVEGRKRGVAGLTRAG